MMASASSLPLVAPTVLGSTGAPVGLRRSLPQRTHLVSSSFIRGRNLLLILCLVVYTVACVSIFIVRPFGPLMDDTDAKSNANWGLELLFKNALKTEHPPHPAESFFPAMNDPRTKAGQKTDSTGTKNGRLSLLGGAKANAQPPKASSKTKKAILIRVPGEEMCLELSTFKNEWACDKLKFEKCNALEARQQWHQERDMTVAGSAGACLDMYRDGSNIHACTCHRDENQKWVLSNGRFQSELHTAKCLGYHRTGPILEMQVVSCEDKESIFETEMVESVRDPAEKRLEELLDLLVIRPYKPAVIDSTADRVNWEDTEAMDFVRSMTEFAFSGYQAHAWGHDELKPNARTGRNWLGHSGLAATIVDSLDTLYIMGLDKQYEAAAQYTEKTLNFDIDAFVSFFETAIRDLGGLLSAYALTGNEIFLQKADSLGDRLLPAFASPHGLPFGQINLRTGSARNHNWMPNNHILSEIGTVQLEFKYLAHLTGKRIFYDKAEAVMEYMRNLQLVDQGLYPVTYPLSGVPMHFRDYTLGGLGDSYYEYELKQWLQSNRTEDNLLQMYDDSAAGIQRVLVGRSQGTDKRNYVFVGKVKNDYREPMMEHLACFSGGMFALGAWSRSSLKDTSAEMQTGADLTETCRESYHQTKTGLGPEKFKFTPDGRVVPEAGGGSMYFLRPEYAESLFYMWRFTHDPKYREWGWDMVNALVKHCRADTGFSGVVNVDTIPAGHNDQQESFFFAETLKYLYLLYADDSLLSLDKWVFNTEAHPLPVIDARWVKSEWHH